MKMARAALVGGAVGIRANGFDDCMEIKKNVDLPMIAINKKVYGTSNVYITPTMKEVIQLLPVEAEIIAVDATKRERPDGSTLQEFYNKIREVYDGLIMADISSFDEAVEAERIGFDLVSTTLSSYTEYTVNRPKPDIELIEQLKAVLSIPIIAEGNIETPELAAKCIKAGAFAIVVGAAITRPQLITKKFVEELNKEIV
jgi:N-acylglucosamine-6-phosphate 2-epimerase